tara:strand:- start:509 stop:775 length:267 start_codon:yes stop_codon:yes gene_type:complete
VSVVGVHVVGKGVLLVVGVGVGSVVGDWRSKNSFKTFLGVFQKISPFSFEKNTVSKQSVHFSVGATVSVNSKFWLQKMFFFEISKSNG